MRLGIIARADKTGLGNQTRNLVKMLNPNKVLVIDSRQFNKNEQFFSTYKGYDRQISRGFLNDLEINKFLRNLDIVLTCELFYSNNFINIANRRGVKTINQYNYEFFDNFTNNRLPLPTQLISPSKWHLEKMERNYNAIYLPPPIETIAFEEVYQYNIKREGKKRFLHIVGREAVNDRNGTLDLLESLKYSNADFELVIKVQSGSILPEQYQDPRVTFDFSSPESEVDLYKDFDLLILPRRYAGLCLPMNEALMSAMPVIMTDIDPNNKVLPKGWLVPSELKGSFMTRTTIDLYSADHKELAKKIDEFAKLSRKKLLKEKEQAREIGYNNYSDEQLRERYIQVLSDVANN